MLGRSGTGSGAVASVAMRNLLQGTATLAAGTATVANTGFGSNTQYIAFVQAETAGANAGHLHVTRNSNSLVITSSNAADTRPVRWLVIRIA